MYNIDMIPTAKPSQTNVSQDKTGANSAIPAILVVEDSPDMRDFLQRVLLQWGYRFIPAMDGAEGIALARTEKPDLILMDLSLPCLDGLEATRQIKADPNLQHIPIIAVTAHARTADEVQAKKAGCDAYISKPYGLRKFADLIRSYAPSKHSGRVK